MQYSSGIAVDATYIKKKGVFFFIEITISLLCFLSHCDLRNESMDCF